jgi:hypothetical protein
MQISWFVLCRAQAAPRSKDPKREKDPKLIQIKNDLSRINFDGKKSSH